MEARRIIVVGGNAAGAAAAAKAARISPSAKVTILEAGEFISTGTCELPYVLTGEIDEYKKIVFFDEKTFRAEKGAEVLINSPVTAIDRRRKEVTFLKGGEEATLAYDKLILCTGAKSRVTDLNNYFPSLEKDETPENFYPFKNVSDLIKIDNEIKSAKQKRICILGSGYIGLELCESFRSLSFEVFLIEKEKRIFPAGDEEASKISEEILKANNVRIYKAPSYFRFRTSGRRITTLVVEGYDFEIDFVINATGFIPDNGLAEKCNLEIGDFGGLRVSTKMQTSDPNIFAAGDNTESTNFITRRPMYLLLATLAHKGGHIAGENAAGGNSHLKPVIPAIALKLFSTYLGSAGLGFSAAKEYFRNVKQVQATHRNLVHVMPGSRPLWGKIIFDADKRILGGSFAGGPEVSGLTDLVSAAIRFGIPADRLEEIDFNYTPALSPFINILSILGRKAE
ncbi:MAG: FAD-dependent oxidoreductase [Ignavibacteriaceae bacterium]